MIIANEGQDVCDVREEDACRLSDLIMDRAFNRMIASTLCISWDDVSFITIVSVFLSTRLLRHRGAASARRSFLLRTIFPIATVRLIDSKAIRLTIRFVIDVGRVRESASGIRSPRVDVRMMIRVEGVRCRLLTLLVRCAISKRLTGILYLMVNGLLTIRERYLYGMAMTMRRASYARINITVKDFFRMIANGCARATKVCLGCVTRAVLRARVDRKQTLTIELRVRMYTRLKMCIVRSTRGGFIVYRYLRFDVARAFRRGCKILSRFFPRDEIGISRRFNNFVVPYPPSIVYRFERFLRFNKGIQFRVRVFPIEDICVAGFGLRYVVAG